MNKNLIFISFIFLLFVVANANAGTYNATCDYNTTTTFNITSATYVQNYSVGGQDGVPIGLYVNTSGLSMYMVGNANIVFKYPISTAWDLSTASYTYQNYSATHQTTSRGITFADTGLKMYIVGETQDVIVEYNIYPAWNISNSTYVQNYSVSSREPTPQGLHLTLNGTRMYVVGSTSNSVIEYNLTTAYNISTMTYLRNYSIGARETTLEGVTLSANGTFMFVIGVSSDSVIQYVLSNPYNVSSAGYLRNYSVSSREGSPTSVQFDPNGVRMYVMGYANDRVIQYNLNYTLNCSTASLINITSPAPINYTTTTILVNISNLTAVDTIWYNWNGTNVTYTLPVNTTFTTGQHTLQVWANNTGGDTENINITFRVYDTPEDITFTSNYQLVMNNTNVTFTWTHGSSYWPLKNYTLYICKPNMIFECPVVNSYSVSNTTTSFNYTNGSTGQYNMFIETCNDVLCSNSSESNSVCFNYVTFDNIPSLVTSLENYEVSVLATDSIYNGCGSISSVEIFKDIENNTAIFSTPYYQSSYNTSLYENNTYTFNANVSYLYNSINFILKPSPFDLTIYNFTITNCSDSSGYLNYITATESNVPVNASIGNQIEVIQPLGNITYNLTNNNTNSSKLCIYPKKNYYLNNDIFYSFISVGRTEEYYLRNALYNFSLNNTLYLYSVNGSDVMSIVVLDEFSVKKPNAIVSMVKFYPDTMTSKTVSSQKTNEEGVANFFYNTEDLIKIVITDDENVILKEDDTFNKYFTTTGFYSRTIKLGSYVLPDVSQITYSCSSDSVGNITTTTCEFYCADLKQRNYSLILYDVSFGNYSIFQTKDIYTCSGTLDLNSTAYNTWYEFKIDGVTYLNGVGKYNPSLLPTEIKMFVFPLLILTLVIGAINPIFAVAGLIIISMFSFVESGNFLYFDFPFLLGAIGIITISLIIENFKTKK